MSTSAVVPAASAPQPSNIVTLKRAIQYAADHITPPSYLHIQQEDDILVKIFAPTIALPFTVNVEFRVLYPADATHPEAEIRPTRKQVLVNATSVTLRFNLNEGFILSASASLAAGATANRGQVFVQMFVVRGIAADLITLWTLLSDYVTTNFRPTWPNAGPRGPVEGPGNIRMIVGTAQAFPLNVAETVPALTRWRLRSITLALNTGVTVVNRTVLFLIDDGATSYYRVASPSVQAASLTWRYVVAPNSRLDAQASAIVNMPLPIDSYLPAGHRFVTAVTNYDATDSWITPVYSVEEWADI